MVAGALVVLPLSFFQVLRAAHGNEQAPRAAAQGEPATPSIAAEQLAATVQTAVPAAVVELGPVEPTSEAQLALEPDSRPAPRERPAPRANQTPAPVPQAATSTPRPEPKQSTNALRSEKQSKKNALDYDFGI